MVKRRRESPLPSITPLQFLVLRRLAAGPMLGVEMRQYLVGQKHPISDPAFYQLMGRMEKAKLVKGVYVDVADAGHYGQTIQEVQYTITDEVGLPELAYVFEFYRKKP